MRPAAALLLCLLVLGAGPCGAQTRYDEAAGPAPSGPALGQEAAVSTAAVAAAAASRDLVALRAFLSRGKRQTMAAHQRLLAGRYDLSEKVDEEPGHTMTNGKPLPLGPVARPGPGFPYPPLPHPDPVLGHFLFPAEYLGFHADLERVDADFDLPDSYLPEKPQPLFLASRPELGDVSKGRQITLGNYRELLEGVLSPQELEGMRLLLTPRPTLWFNRSEHRLSERPVPGVSCFSCHGNGHTDGAIALEPATRPRTEAVRLDTPSLRGVGRARLLGSKRAIRSLSEFAEVEDYFEQETDLAKLIGVRPLDHYEAAAVSAMLSIIDFPPNPKLTAEGRLDPARASASELAGEKLFFGKARCGACHPAPYFSDQEMHDLKVERLAGGRAEGAFKTPTLRAIKDSPPYYHDGRLPTLEDGLEFFDRVLELGLSKAEKKQLADFLKAL